MPNTELAPSFSRFMSQVVAEADEEARREREARESEEHARVESLKARQTTMFEQALGPILQQMQAEGFVYAAVHIPKQERNYNGTRQEEYAYLQLRDPETERVLDVRYLDDKGDGQASFHITIPVGPKKVAHANATPDWPAQTHEVQFLNFPRGLALTITACRQYHAEQVSWTEQERVRREQKEAEERQQRAMEQARQRRRAEVERVQAVARREEHRIANVLLDEARKEMEAQAWVWPEVPEPDGGRSPWLFEWYSLRIVAGAYADEEGEVHWNEHTELSMEASPLDGWWPIVRDGRHLPTKLQQGQTVEITKHWGCKVADLPREWQECVRAKVYGLDSKWGDGDELRFFRAPNKVVEIDLPRRPLCLIRQRIASYSGVRDDAPLQPGRAVNPHPPLAQDEAAQLLSAFHPDGLELDCVWQNLMADWSKVKLCYFTARGVAIESDALRDDLTAAYHVLARHHDKQPEDPPTDAWEGAVGLDDLPF
jgi:hypothetical protein